MEKRSNYKSKIKELKKIYGCSPRCVNCGCEENIEWHHIVPLHCGGKDIISNIVPLCHSCHWSIHSGMEQLKHKQATRGGRKQAEHIEGYYSIQEMCGLTGKTARNFQQRIRRGKMKAVKIKNAWYVKVEDYKESYVDNWYKKYYRQA